MGLPRHTAASFLPALLLFVAMAVTAPSLFGFVMGLVRPLFSGLVAAAPTATTAAASTMPSWFTLATPLLQVLGALFGLAMLASLAALALRRALVR